MSNKWRLAALALPLRSVFICVHLWFLFLVSPAMAQDAVIHLKNGGVVEVRIVNFGETGLSFRTDASLSAAQMPYDQIANTELPPPDDFTRAMQYFDFGRFVEAATMFEPIAEVKTPATGYPAPGNFASLSQRRLLDCYRRLADGAAVAKHLEKLEPEKLPVSEREMLPVMHAWAAAGAGDWKVVLKIEAETAAAEGFSNASEQGIEFAYLKGLALKESGDPREAILSFATAYTLNAATDPRISRAALMEAATLVEQDEERLSEFRAQIHLYGSIFGKGELWSEADGGARSALGGTVEIGEAALGQTGRSSTVGEFMEETFGLRAIEQVTADHMKKVGLGRKAAGSRKKK